MESRINPWYYNFKLIINNLKIFKAMILILDYL